jgi:hypothetical protein
MAPARVASRSKAPEDHTNNLPPLDKQKNDRIMDVWMQTDGRTDGRRKDTKKTQQK